MAFDWTIFAEEIGKVGERAAAGVRQRGIEKRAEERAYRMHEEKLKIEEPFKELESERILARQKELAQERTELQKGLEEWRGQLSRELDIFAGSEGYQKAIETARKEGGLSQVAVMRMEDSIMRARRGELPDISDFEGLPPFDRLKIMDLLKQNQMIMTTTQQKQQALDMEAQALQSTLDARGRGLVDVKRGLDITTKLETNIEDAEEELGDYFSELMNELAGAKKGSKKFIDKKGRLEVTGRNKDLLFDVETGDFNKGTLDKLYAKYPQYKKRFDRLFRLQANVTKHELIKDQFTPGEPTVSNTWTSPEGKIWETGEIGVATKGKYKGKKIRHLGNGEFELVE